MLVLDIRPCPLCLEQRYAYYLALPLAAFVAFFASRRGLSPPRLALMCVSLSALTAALTTGILAGTRVFSSASISLTLVSLSG